MTLFVIFGVLFTEMKYVIHFETQP